MSSPQVLMIGCGDIGTRAGIALAERGWRVAGVRRNPQQLPPSIQPFAGDYTRADGLSSVAMLRPDYIVFSPLPAGRDAAGYQRGYLEAIHHIVASGVAEQAKRLVFISSTRVYAEADGGWVNETSPLTTTDPAALAIIAAEQAAAKMCPTTVLRASGIYGDIPGMLLKRVLSGEGSDDPSRWSNRIHRQDLADIVSAVLLRDAADEAVPSLLIASDDSPALLTDVEQGLADALQRTLKPTASTRQARANRRCSNHLLRTTGFSLQYPNWQMGYRAVLSDLAAQGVYQPDLAALPTPSSIKAPE